jgi:hypothetical protein
MSISVLQKKDHKPEHDLESLFYVLVWICSLYTGPGKPREGLDKLSHELLPVLDWADSQRSFQQIADLKKGHVLQSEDFQERVLQYYSEYFRPLKQCCENLRQLFFPSRDPAVDHKQFIIVLQEALKTLPKETTLFVKPIHNVITLPYITLDEEDEEEDDM